MGDKHEVEEGHEEHHEEEEEEESENHEENEEHHDEKHHDSSNHHHEEHGNGHGHGGKHDGHKKHHVSRFANHPGTRVPVGVFGIQSWINCWLFGSAFVGSGFFLWSRRKYHPSRSLGNFQRTVIGYSLIVFGAWFIIPYPHNKQLFPFQRWRPGGH